MTSLGASANTLGRCHGSALEYQYTRATKFRRSRAAESSPFASCPMVVPWVYILAVDEMMHSLLVNFYHVS